MKKAIFIFLSLAVSTTLTVKAQNAPANNATPKVRAEKTLEKLQSRLLLTDKQKTSLFLILLEQNNKVDSLKNVQASPVIIKDQFKSSYQKIAGLLTPDQLKKYGDWMTEVRSKASH